MGRSKETFGKKEVRNKQVKKRKDKEKRRLDKKEQGKNGNFDDMIAWVDLNGTLCSSPPDFTDKEEIVSEQIEISTPKAEFRKSERILKGKIKNFDMLKGFGFIHSPEINDSIFVHVNDCSDEIKTGDWVTFKTEKGIKGLKATNVKKIS
jgi:cold shock CspA family protein